MLSDASACYGKEPFDLRLTVLGMIRKLHIIICITVLGTLLFGGGYYVKNVLLYDDLTYMATSTYMVGYTIDPNLTEYYFVNDATWNTYLDSKMFRDKVWEHLQELTDNHATDYAASAKELAEMIVAEVKVATDVHVPSTVVTAGKEEWALLIAQAVEQTMVEDLATRIEQLTSIEVIDPAMEAEAVLPDVRPMRAFVLSAILSCFFAVVALLLKELGDDSIRLPATLRRRYGLVPVGTVNSPELKANLEHLFADMKNIAVCAVDEEVNPMDVTKMLQELKEKDASLKHTGDTVEGVKEQEWIAIPAPMLCPEACEKMREADGILLVIKAGSHAGKPLEYVLEYLATQDITVSAALLWDADEWLIRTYYRLPFAKQDETGEESVSVE